VASKTPYIVGIGGTTRSNSSTEKALRHALRACEQEGATTALFGAAELAALPHYAPELPDRAEGARRLVDELRRADGVIVASPGYHGGVSGMVKNALDYTEDLREDSRPYFSGVPVGCIATGAGWQAIVTTLEALRAIVHALRGWPTPLGAAINTAQLVFSADGECQDEKVDFQLTTLAQEVLQFVRWKIAAAEAAGV
jgi:FMN reductase